LKRILVTGAGGLIGSGIAEYLKKVDKDIEITGITSRKTNIENMDHTIKTVLGEPLTIPKERYDIIIHCAFDKKDKSNNVNTTGTIRWAKDALQAGVKEQIFMSSISSQSKFLTPYGKSKKYLEEWFFNNNFHVFRLGLVIANGGMLGRLIKSVNSSPVIPIIGGDKFPIFPTDPNTIYDLIYRIIIGEIKSEQNSGWNLQFKEATSLKKILTCLKKISGKKTFLIPLPYTLIYPIVKLAELLKISGLEIDTDNLKGLKRNSKISIRSDLSTLGYKERNLAEMIESWGRSLTS